MINRDTIMSVGVVMSRSLPFVDVNTTIRVFRQALSLDEVCGQVMICPPLSRQLSPASTVPGTAPTCIKVPRLETRRDHLSLTLPGTRRTNYSRQM